MAATIKPIDKIMLTRKKAVIIIHENPIVGQKPQGIGLGLSRFMEFVCSLEISKSVLELQTTTTFRSRIIVERIHSNIASTGAIHERHP